MTPTATAPPPGLPPLPMSQTETGALATAPLSAVVNAATDALYQDLFDLVHGEIKIESVTVASSGTSASATGAGGIINEGESGKGSSASSGMDTHAAMAVEGKLTAAALGVNFIDSTAAPATTTTTTSATASNPNDTILETRKQRMANLSFAQRRHELTRRIVQHTKSIAHVYALTAASLPESHAAMMQQKAALRTNPSHLATLNTTTNTTTTNTISNAKIPPRLGAMVEVSSDALQFVKSRWVSQDEAQDALYFHHDSLWKARAHCHDVLGALCVLSTPGGGDGGGGGGGRWPDFPTDVALAVDRYATSKERAYPASELQARLASAVRRKLVLGEVGTFGTLGSASKTYIAINNDASNSNSEERTQVDNQPLPWRVILAKGGGSIRLTYGNPRTVSTASALRQRSVSETNGDGGDQSNIDYHHQEQYPIEARLSVLSEEPSAPWKLLSLHVRCSPKTGESDHQLRMNRKQMFDLHRIGERAMIVEEAICRKANETKLLSTLEKEDSEVEKEGSDVIMMEESEPIIAPASSPFIARPLYRLFEVAHAFALSLQIEMLSSQAEALRRGTWGVSMDAGTSRAARGGGALSEGIEVSPVYFYEQNDTGNDRIASDGKPSPIAIMAIHFWSCDDTYGSPQVCDICERVMGEDENGGTKKRDDAYLPKSDRRGDKRLSLCIRAVATVGLVVSLSGGSNLAVNASVLDDDTANDTSHHHTKRNVNKLLSSIRNPFELSMSDALLAATVLCADRRCHAVVAALTDRKSNHLPSWLHLNVECGSISVAALLSYSTSSASASTRPFTVLFRLACDSRTGRFIPVFPRPATLLRLLACNDHTVSDVQSFRMAKATDAQSMVTKKGGTNATTRADSITREFTGRIVRDAFDALARSTDTLGRKCGVGGNWNDIDAQSASLRAKSIDVTCRDVRVALMNCSAMAAVFGVATMALKIAGGVDPVLDM